MRHGSGEGRTFQRRLYMQFAAVRYSANADTRSTLPSALGHLAPAAQREAACSTSSLRGCCNVGLVRLFTASGNLLHSVSPTVSFLCFSWGISWGITAAEKVGQTFLGRKSV